MARPRTVPGRDGTSGDPHPAGAAPDVAVAVVVTYRRPRLATAVVRGLIDVERFEPGRVLLVVNGEGGLTDPVLERQIRTIRLEENLGPAGGFRAGMAAAFESPDVRWAYLCEDDIGLFDLPSPRVVELIGTAEAWTAEPQPIGAVVAYGRRFAGRGGGTLALVPGDGPGAPLHPVDTAAWGATLVSRSVFDAGVLPDTRLFFGYEDFDFFLAMRRAGFALMMDDRSARAVAGQMSLNGRNVALRSARPVDADEAWRAYYVARNFFALARRYGDRRWLAWHLLYSLRRIQLAHSWAERWATIHGVTDGARGRLGKNPRYTRSTGEWQAVP